MVDEFEYEFLCIIAVLCSLLLTLVPTCSLARGEPRVVKPEVVNFCAV